MPRELMTDAEIDEYVARIVEAAHHHGHDVNRVILPLATAVRGRLKRPGDQVYVYERNGKLGRTCWVTIDDHRHVFSYSYADKQIVLRSRLRGETKARFDNDTSPEELTEQIDRL